LKQAYLYCTLFLVISVFGNANIYAQNSEDKIYDMINAVSIDNLSEHIQILENAGGTKSRITFTPGVDSAAMYVKRVFDSYSGLTSVELDTFYISTAETPYNTKPQFNVVATIEGRTNPEKVFVIGAHLDATADRDRNWKKGDNWDTIEAPGADDNATGIASILELARIMTDEQFGFVNDFTIKLVAFGAEEKGANYYGNHHGSSHMAGKLFVEKIETIGMVSMDMIGFNPSNDYASIVKNSDYGASITVPLGQRFYDANINFSIGLITNKAPFENGTYSDHQSFDDLGMPAILLIENAPWKRNDYYDPNPYYHTSFDTFETLNMVQVKKITQLNIATMASYNGVTTGLELEDEDTPNQMILSQNYPNPFNPATTIKFQLQEPGQVSLKVYNMLGREIAVLVNGMKSAGSHEIVFDANNIGNELSSGVYIYQLQTDRSVIRNKMTLIK